MATVIDLRDLGDRGFLIEGAAKDDNAGSSVRAGDFNGDGLADLIVCAPGVDSGGRGNQGAVYVIYGTGHGFDTVDLAAFTPALGDVFRGERERDFLSRAASAGDVNGDGVDDLILGAPGNDHAGKFSGSAYIIFGKVGGLGPLDLASLTPDQGYRIDGGSRYTLVGGSVASAGDVNGDGLADVVMGANERAYVLFGRVQGFGSIDLRHLSPDDGFVALGDDTNQGVGGSVTGVGDVNGDGYADVVVGARLNDDAGHDAGAAYVLFGKADGFASIDLANLAPSDGFVLRGEEESRAGSSVGSAGDVNGDGYADFIVGAPYLAGGGGRGFVGAAYVIFGKGGGFGSIDLGHLAPADGFVISLDVAQAQLGASVS